MKRVPSKKPQNTTKTFNKEIKYFVTDVHESGDENYVNELTELTNNNKEIKLSDFNQSKLIIIKNNLNKVKRPDHENAKIVIQKSLYLEKLNIPGCGLFAKTKFKKNEVITFYDGYCTNYIKKSDLTPEQYSHSRTVYSLKSMILGNHLPYSGEYVTNPTYDFINLGGASYANHSDQPNAKFMIIEYHYKTTTTTNQNSISDLNIIAKIAEDPNNRLIVITAIKDIDIDEEILINYGSNYDFNFDKNNSNSKNNKESNRKLISSPFPNIFCSNCFSLKPNCSYSNNDFCNEKCKRDFYRNQ